MEKLLQEIENLIYLSSSIKQEVKSIILIGSQYQIENIQELKGTNSDLDMIAIIDGNSFISNKNINGLQIDISFVNQNDIIGLITSALKGSKFSGKIFSSIQPHRILKDQNNIGQVFTEVIESLYQTFTQSCFPDHKINDNFFHNINANLKDLYKPSSEESLFTYHRLFTHLFTYINKLSYPFITSGSYQGKMIKKYYSDFYDSLNLDENENPIIDIRFLQSNLNRFFPKVSSQYKAVIYNEYIKEKINDGLIDVFYFGYDNLIDETTIVFIHQKYLIDQEFTIINASDIIPLLSQENFNLYTSILIDLSKKYLKKELKERIEIFKVIIKYYKEKGLIYTIIQSIKSSIIVKTAEEISKEGARIDIYKFKEWFDSLDIELATGDSPYNHITKINILGILDDATNTKTSVKEVQIIANYTFFGIMKSLRIKIQDLEF